MSAYYRLMKTSCSFRKQQFTRWWCSCICDVVILMFITDENSWIKNIHVFYLTIKYVLYKHVEETGELEEKIVRMKGCKLLFWIYPSQCGYLHHTVCAGLFCAWENTSPVRTNMNRKRQDMDKATNKGDWGWKSDRNTEMTCLLRGAVFGFFSKVAKL